MKTLLSLLLLAATAAAAESTITVESLLNEMVNYDAVARLPEPAYTCQQFSSYDRATKTPDDAKGWFANNDQNQFIRIETVNGRTEKVMMDTDGPGAIVRFWITTHAAKKGNIRIYLDGADTPAITVPSFDFSNNDAIPAGTPLNTLHPGATPQGRGGNTLYLPIPYAKHCKVTWEELEAKAPRYYQINYRTYPAGIRVETFKPGGNYAPANQLLAQPPVFTGGRTETMESDILPGGANSWVREAGPAAIRWLELQVSGLGFQPKNSEQATGKMPVPLEPMRSVVLHAEFDGEQTIWCPVGDFFGCGVDGRALDSWYRTVTPTNIGQPPHLNPLPQTTGERKSPSPLPAKGAGQGEGSVVMTCRWVMPFQKNCRFTLRNLGTTRVKAKLNVRYDKWNWDDRSLHFHANWRHQDPIATRPMRDWNYLSATGAGRYVGDQLVIYNPVKQWWGEGDEKIYVDGESFPSHIGTGTEDYYNYSWSHAGLFQTPFANQVRCDGPGNQGYSIVNRTRSLDAIPFTKSLRFDMEVWHWADCNVGCAATTFWYARPGATCNRPPQPDEAARPLHEPAPPFRLAGAVECEKMQITAKSPDVPAEIQTMSLAKGEWSDGSQLWVRGKRIGDFVELRIPATKKQKLTLYATKSWDYGILRFTVNGQVAGKDYDAWAEKPVASGPIELGVFEPKDGAFLLRVEVVGANPQSRNSKSFFGLDAVTLTAP